MDTFSESVLVNEENMTNEKAAGNDDDNGNLHTEIYILFCSIEWTALFSILFETNGKYLAETG